MKKNVKIKIVGEVESKPYIDMTIEVLKKYGVEVSEQNNLFYINKIEFKPLEYIVESDYSSASNFIVYNALTNGNIEILNLSNKIIQADSMIHDLLKKIDKKEIISLKNCPDLGPILFVYAAFKNYETIFIDVKRLEFKESNRIISMQEELRKTGIDFKYDGDKVIIKGKEVHNSNFVFETHNDHRVAMALSVFAMINNGNSIINNAEVVNKSFPSFYKILQELKADIKII